MSKATFDGGAITFPAEAKVEPFRVVKLGAKGVKHADATGGFFGAVLTAAAPESPAVAGMVPIPSDVAVHYGPHTVQLEVDGTAADIKPGAKVFAAADGKVSAAGTVVVGIAVRAGAGKLVKTLLNPPAPA